MQVWSMFGYGQRWFNCVEDEWELCRDLDPYEEPDDLVSEYATDGYTSVDGTLQGWRTRDTAIRDHNCSTNAPTVFKVEDMRDISATEKEEIVTDVLDVVCSRFGLSYASGDKYDNFSNPPIKLQKALRIFGDGYHEPVYTMRQGTEASFIQYVMYLNAVGHPENDITEVPSSLCDLYPDNYRFIGKQLSTVVVTQVEHIDSALYVIRHRSSADLDWVLAVNDPCTALQCARSNPSSMCEVIRGLILSKTMFFTFKCFDDVLTDQTRDLNSRPKPYISKRTGLGRRPADHILDLTDFIAYEGAKARLLQDKRIARAVVKRGGIVARLASGLVDEYDIIDGPKFEEGGRYIRVPLTIDGETREYFDDDLSLEEMATFVGLYSFEGMSTRYVRVNGVTSILCIRQVERLSYRAVVVANCE